MTETPREVLSRELGGIPISEDVDIPRLARELSRVTHDDQQARERARVDAKHSEAQARHDAIAQHLTGTLREVFDHHAPHKPGRYSAYADEYCSGCDGTSYDDSIIDWPCSTWELIAKDQADPSPTEES